MRGACEIALFDGLRAISHVGFRDLIDFNELGACGIARCAG